MTKEACGDKGKEKAMLYKSEGMTKGSYSYKRTEIRNTRGAGIKKKVQDKDYEGWGSRGTEGPGQGRGGDEEKEKNRGES